MSDSKIIVIILVVFAFVIGTVIGVNTTVLVSNHPIKLSYTLSCEDGKCDTTYKASTRGAG